MNYLKQQKKFITVSLLLTLIYSAVSLLTPLFLNTFFKENSTFNYKKTLILLITMLLAFLLQLGLIIFRENFSISFNQKNSVNLFKKLYNMDYQAIKELEPTYLTNRIMETISNIYLFSTGSFINSIGNVFIIIISLLLFFNIDVAIGLLMLFVLPINYLSYKKINKSLQEKSKAMSEKNASSMQQLINITNNVDHIKQQPNFNTILNLLTHPLTQIFTEMSNINKFAKGTSLSIEFLNNFIQTIMFLVLSLLTIQGDKQINHLVMASILSPIYFTTIKSFTQSNLDYQRLKIGEEFIHEDLDANLEDNGLLKLDKINSITLEHPKLTLADRHFTWSINEKLIPGDVLCVTGLSGNGKSSLVKSLLGFYPISGVTINQTAIRNLNKQSLRQHISYISQTATIIPGTIEENIKYGRNSEKIDWNSPLFKTILSPLWQNKSPSTLLLENGGNLSGGEKQRINIARHLVGNYDLLILDEITTGLETLSAHEIMTAITKNPKNIIIYISHDDSMKHYANKWLNL